MFSRVWQSYEVPKVPKVPKVPNVPNVPIKMLLANSLRSLKPG